MSNDWVEIGASGDNEERDMHDFKKAGELAGIYVGMTQKTGKMLSNAYQVDKADGTKVAFWGSSVLETKMEQVPRGNEVRITPLGKKDGKNGFQYNDYEVQTRPVSGEDSDGMPF